MKEASERRRIATDKIVWWLRSVSERVGLDLLRKTICDNLSIVRAAEPIEAPALREPRPPNPGDYSIIGIDGSQIELDPHAPVYCYLLNYGVAILRYQKESAAWLFSQSELGFRPEDLTSGITDHPIALSVHLLGVRRQLGEADLLARLAEADGRLAAPSLALQDGAMRLSLLDVPGIDQNQRDEFTQHHLRSLDRIRDSQTPVASYVSRPRSDDVVHALRSWLHDFGSSDSGLRTTELTTADFEGICDRDIFSEVLSEVGDRSAVFCSSWRTSRDKYREHRIHFVYLNTGVEIARVDLPEWVAKDSDDLRFVHSTIVDQIEKGLGYPVSLTEAHEQATVRTADRRVFWEVLEREARRTGLSISPSAKAGSKLTRPA